MHKKKLPIDLQRVLLTIICDSDYLLGFFLYSDILKMAMTSKSMHDVLHKKTKSLKRVLRFGNLDVNLRKKLWVKLINR